MQNFKFNTLYIIESLKKDEKKTGLSLYEDAKLQEFIHEGLRVCYKSIETGKEWDMLMDDISKECQIDAVKPILHLELHGCETGIGFTNGDFRSIEQVGEQFRKINIASGCNLFLTLGVCKGLYVLFNTHIDRPMPFCGAIGSFSTLMAGNIEICYAEFYGTFFRTFDITKAYIALLKANKDIEHMQYRYIRVDEVFYKAYRDYINKECVPNGMKQRALDAAKENGIEFINRKHKRFFQREFVQKEKETREPDYQNAIRTFFQLDEYPENRERFDVPDSYSKLDQRCSEIIET